MTRAQILTHVRPRMGTLLAVTMPKSRPETVGRYLSTVFETATACERVMSRHKPNSAVSRLNRVAGCPCGLSSPDLARVLRRAQDLAHATDGAFDPTVGPVLRVWRMAARRHASPGARRLRAARAAVGWRAIRVRGSRVALRRPGMAVELGGFGKGVALDLIVGRLKRDGCESALLNFGESSLVAIGWPPAGSWGILLRHPAGGFVGEFPLAGRACSTSATFGQTVKIGPRRLSHIVDPRTGRPVRRRAQVTVLARSAAVAEAASTALLVLGRAAMPELAERLRIDACWVDTSGTSTTPRFPLRPFS